MSSGGLWLILINIQNTIFKLIIYQSIHYNDFKLLRNSKERLECQKIKTLDFTWEFFSPDACVFFFFMLRVYPWLLSDLDFANLRLLPCSLNNLSRTTPFVDISLSKVEVFKIKTHSFQSWYCCKVRCTCIPATWLQNIQVLIKLWGKN